MSILLGPCAAGGVEAFAAGVTEDECGVVTLPVAVFTYNVVSVVVLLGRWDMLQYVWCVCGLLMVFQFPCGYAGGFPFN
jgi:hypothetical protein